MRAQVGAITLAYDDVGGGLPVVFLHGFPHNRRLWAPQLRALGSCCRCIAPDLRGFGESTVAPPYTMDQYADDISRLLDALGVERALIAGLSMGGYIAFAIWRRHRHRVQALVLADTRAGADTEEGKRKRRAMIALARSEGSEAVAEQMIAGMVGSSTREKRPDTVEAVRAMLAAAPVDGVVGAIEAMIARPDSTATLATIDVPALIVVGEEDVLTPPDEARALHDAIADSRLEVIPAAGHVSSFERPAAFNSVVSDFVGALGG